MYAVEKNREALLLEENKRKFAADWMEIVKGTAPEALEDLPVPSHVFIGGSSGNLKTILQTVRLKNSGGTYRTDSDLPGDGQRGNGSDGGRTSAFCQGYPDDSRKIAQCREIPYDDGGKSHLYYLGRRKGVLMRIPRIVFAAPSSGSGKTVTACALLKALSMQGRKVAAYKCGPDYIDPMFHREVLGIETGNLDLFFCEREKLGQMFCRQAKDKDIAVIEGVMGYYDGIRMDSYEASSYDVARTLKAPGVLILSPKGMALSAAAIVEGIIRFQKDSNIRGILLNRTGEHPVSPDETDVGRRIKKAGIRGASAGISSGGGSLFS